MVDILENIRSKFCWTTKDNTEKQYTDHLDFFREIIGYDDLKLVVFNTIFSIHKSCTLLNGSPGTGKTMFLNCIEKRLSEKMVIISVKGYDLSGAGFRNKLVKTFNEKGIVDLILVDEISRAPKKEQHHFLGILDDDSRIQTTKADNDIDISLANVKVVATCNNYDKLIEPLIDRFSPILHIPPYTEEQFMAISIYKLGLKGYSIEIGKYLSSRVLQEFGLTSLREVNNISSHLSTYSLSNKPLDQAKKEVDDYINIYKKYSLDKLEEIKSKKNRDKTTR